MATLQQQIGFWSPYAVSAITFFGAFSRFTEGQFSQGFYQYQLERGPATLVIPTMDLVLGCGMLARPTRPFALLMGAVFQGIGIVLRIQQGRDFTPDVALFTLATVACWASFKSRLAQGTRKG